MPNKKTKRKQSKTFVRPSSKRNPFFTKIKRSFRQFAAAVEHYFTEPLDEKPGKHKRKAAAQQKARQTGFTKKAKGFFAMSAAFFRRLFSKASVAKIGDLLSGLTAVSFKKKKRTYVPLRDKSAEASAAKHAQGKEKTGQESIDSAAQNVQTETNAKEAKQATPTKAPAYTPRKKAGTLRIIADVALLVLSIGTALFFNHMLHADDGRIDVALTDGEETTQFCIYPTTVGDLLDRANVDLTLKDELSAAKTAPLQDGATVSITRAFPVAVNSNNETTILHFTAGTVGEALEEAGVSYDADDELSSEPYESLDEGMVIEHTETTVAYEKKYQVIKYKEKTEKDKSIYKGTTKLKQAGENGEKEITQRVIYKNGTEISREVVNQMVTRAAVDQITLVGTKIKYQTSLVGEYREWQAAPTPGKNGWIKMTVSATGYCSGTRTAKGTKPRLGTIAVNPDYIPYYSKIYIPKFKNRYISFTYGYGEALDTGPFRLTGKNHIDIWFNTKKEAINFGHPKSLTIYVKKP